LKDLSVRLLHSRHRRRRKKPLAKTQFLMLLLFAATAAVTWQFARQQPVSRLSRSSLETVRVGAAEIQVEKANYAEPWSMAARPGRPAYPFSVIPGGVESVEELRQIAEHDRVVARHFQGFDYQHAHLVKVSEKQAMYLAYRMGDKVYWTRKKVALHPGETLISDGKIVARARCGNRVAVAPLGPRAMVGPLDSDLDQPLFTNAMVTHDVDPQPEAYSASLPDGANALLPTSHRKRFLPFFFLPVAALPGGGGGSAHTPLAVAPEPGTLLLLSTGVAGVYWKSRKSRRKR
jgi:PEP-CTERM motif-containing protein